jgi:SPP1 gp7 family putative phage head morphogenesis protein
MTDLTIYNEAFWRGEDAAIIEELGPFALTLLMAGARSGASALPAGLSFLIDWDAFNTSAVDWLRRYEAGWLRGVNGTTRTQVVKIVENWIKAGSHLDSLTEEFKPIFGDDRAAMIAATETTRVYAEGNVMAWRSSGIVTAKRWQTSRDDLVCPVCGPLHNKVVSLEYGWSADGQGKIIESPEGLFAPPAHVRCRCWLLPVVGDEAFKKRLDEVIRNAR